MSTVNVLRYSALALGLLVGFKTDISLRCSATKKVEEDKYMTQVKLVKQAKAEYAKLHPPKAVGNQQVDLNDPNLDYAAVILNAVDSLKST